MRLSIVAACLVLVLVPALLAAPLAEPRSSAAEAAETREDGAAVRRALDAATRMPVLFVEGGGKRASGAEFFVAGRDRTVEFRKDRVEVRMLGGEVPGREGEGRAPFRARPRKSHTLTFRFAGANPSPAVEGGDPRDTRVHSLVGREESWSTGLRTFGRIVYRDLWPGIDLAWSGGPNTLKHEFVVRPGADPSRIRIEIDGADAAAVESDGSLRADTPAGAFRDERPVAWTESAAGRVPVDASFDLSGSGGGWSYGFALGARDASSTLVIDPAQFVYATYLGSDNPDRCLGVAVDRRGCAYVTGVAPSEVHDSFDALVAKFTPDGSNFEYLTGLGGKGHDEGYDIQVDEKGCVYVTGSTESEDFPTSKSAPQKTYGGGFCDAFVTKLAADGRTVIFSSYVGGDEVDFGEGVGFDAQGHIYAEGPTKSGEASFKPVTGPSLKNAGSYDLWVAKSKPDGSGWVYCGFVGGEKDDIGLVADFATAGHLAVGPDGSCYVSGETNSDEKTFPTGSGFGQIPTWDGTHNGDWDAYAIRVKPDGTGLVWAGFLGGDKSDMGFGMGVDAKGNAVITGNANSDEKTFPTGSGFGKLPGFQQKHGGMEDCFAAKIAADGKSLLWATFLGGKKNDNGNGLALDPAGDVYIAGHCESPDFPAVAGPDLSFNGPDTDGDGFACRISADGTKLVWCGFIGGDKDDHAFWIALDAEGNAYVCGDTPSTEATFPDGNGMAKAPGNGMAKKYQGGDWDGFLVKISK
ncbi:MAG: hypothetical protein HMLKMBBP_00502 [Planctomycetes bacterium]|nr:hypothetical protein [Planctomycetota bacterium]